MSTAGKILAIFNVVGLVGLTVLFAMVLGKARTWSYQAYRLELMVGNADLRVPDGLPLDEDETDAQGSLRYKKVGEGTRKELFPDNPVTTQVQEVERVRKDVEEKIKSAGDGTAQTRKLADILLLLARSNQQRERLIAVQTHLASKESIAELKAHLKAAIRPALLLTTVPDKNKRGFGEAYYEAVRQQRGDPSVNDKALAYRVEPKRPFEEALLRAFVKMSTPPQVTEGTELDKWRADIAKALDKAARDLGEKAGEPKSDEEFLQATRGAKNKNFDALFDEAFAEALEAVQTDLKTQLDWQFEEAKATNEEAIQALTESGKPPPKGIRLLLNGKPSPLSSAERRAAAARLLLCLVEADPEFQVPEDPLSAPEYRRVQNVVGWKTFNQTLDNEAQTLHRIAVELDREIAGDRNTFVTTHRELMLMVQRRAREWDADKQRLDDQTTKVAEAKKLADEQKARVTLYEDKVATGRKESDKRMQELRKLTADMFDIRLKGRDATDNIQADEAKIRELEAKFKKGSNGR